MRTAQDIVADYRRRGYSDERIRALANNRPEPIRSEILAMLDVKSTPPTNAPAQEIDIMADTHSVEATPSSQAAPESAERPAWKLDSDFVRQVRANLAPIQVEHVTAEEFYARQCEDATTPPEGIDVVAVAEAQSPIQADVGESLAAQTGQVEMAEDGDVVLAGEMWPPPAADEMPPPLAAAAEEAYAACLQKDNESVIDVEELKRSKAGQRSLDVIRQTIEADAELAASVQEVDNKIIFLSPPYAMEEVAAADEESKLIEFPAEMIESYDAIRSVQVGSDHAAAAADVAAAPTASDASAEPQAPAAEAFSLEGEINRLRNWLAEMEDDLKLKDLEIQNLIKKLGERDETVAVLNRELEEARRSLAEESARKDAGDSLAAAYEAAQAEHAQLVKQLADIQKEYNELATTTLPELLKDKEDLVALLEEQTAMKTAAESAWRQSRRRVSYSYLVTAAALLIALFVPLFHGLSVANREEEWNRAREGLIADAEQAKRLLRVSEEKNAALDGQLAQAKRNFIAERDSLARKNADLTQRLEAQARHIASLKNELAAVANRSALAANNAPAAASAPRNEGIVNLAETRWATPQNAPAAGRADIKTRTAVVRPGDGLIRFLQRECGMYNETLAAWVTKANNLKCNRQGDPMLQPDQVLLVPADPRAVDAAAQAPSSPSQRTN